MTGSTLGNKDTGVSSIPARLETLSFTKLLSGNKAEIERLLVSCQTDGVYYLGLRACKNGEFTCKDTVISKAKLFSKPSVAPSPIEAASRR